MLGLFRKKEKNTSQEVHDLAADLCLMVSSSGEVISFMSLKSDYSSSETISHLIVIHIARLVDQFSFLDEYINRLPQIYDFVERALLLLKSRFEGKHMRKDIYLNDVRAIIKMIDFNPQGFELAKSIIQDNAPFSEHDVFIDIFL
ncbi:hypothetical protein ABN070_14920 [Morganella morganii]|uniref:hypothetical protein n=1 Tax=Morganella morganii TaxID=582 RepID=UPI0032DBF022